MWASSRNNPATAAPDQPAGAVPSGRLAVRGIGKSFPGVRALKDVTFEVGAGEVHALVGENGAGKSTLLKILSGAYHPDEGAIFIDRREIKIPDPRTARSLGIAIVYQELSLIPWLSVANNLFLGRERLAGGGIFSQRRLRALAQAELEKLGLKTQVDRPAAKLRLAEQQLVEIARALSENARFLLMDEPTASLTGREVEVLFEKIRALARAGVGIVYISHRLEEIARIADRLTVLRDGQVVYSGPVGEIDLPEIVAKMVGRKIGEHYPPRTSRPGEEILAVRPPSSASNGRSFSVRAGEVVGLAGLVGAGRTEWAWRLVGASPSLPGEKVRLKGREVRITSPTQARSLGLGLVPESRKEHGLILSCSVRDNIVITILDRLSNFLGFVDRKTRADISRRFVDRLRIRCPHDGVSVSALSGGNQQKVVLAKWLAREGHIIVLDEPTRGIDVGAKVEMYHLINQLSLEGKGVILISSDMPELLSLSDRIYVMRQGRFVAELESAKTSQEEILAFASGFKEAQTV